MNLQRVLPRCLVILAIASAGALVALLSSCGRILTDDYEIKLTEGYSIVRTMQGLVYVVNENNVGVVRPTVDAYRSYTHILIGHVSKCRVPQAQRTSVPGYFILDYQSGKASQGLSKAQWLHALRARGIRKPPVLRKLQQ